MNYICKYISIKIITSTQFGVPKLRIILTSLRAKRKWEESPYMVLEKGVQKGTIMPLNLFSQLLIVLCVIVHRRMNCCILTLCLGLRQMPIKMSRACSLPQLLECREADSQRDISKNSCRGLPHKGCSDDVSRLPRKTRQNRRAAHTLKQKD